MTKGSRGVEGSETPVQRGTPLVTLRGASYNNMNDTDNLHARRHRRCQKSLYTSYRYPVRYEASLYCLAETIQIFEQEPSPMGPPQTRLEMIIDFLDVRPPDPNSCVCMCVYMIYLLRQRAHNSPLIKNDTIYL